MATANASRLAVRIGAADRVFVVGSTGSGKTTLAKALLWKRPGVVILDPKHTFTLPPEWESRTYDDIGELSQHDDWREEHGRRVPVAAIYRPTLAEMDALCDPFFEWVFERRNTVVYVDEVMRVTNGPRIGKGYAAVLQLGRERGIGCWSATQRPANIPRPVMTESEHLFAFRLRAKEDRDRLYEFTGHPEFQTIPPDQNGFYYYSDRSGRLAYYRRADVGRVLEQ